MTLLLVSSLTCGCGHNDNPPVSVRVLAVTSGNGSTLGVHMVLTDEAGEMTAVDGAATVQVTESRSDPYAESGTMEAELFRGQFPVLRSRFRNLKYGKQEREILAFPLESIPFSDFYESPTQPSGTVRIKFRPRYSEKDIEGETAVRFPAASR
jgi:hypothetical protein